MPTIIHRPAILIVEDDPQILRALAHLFTLRQCIAIPAPTLADGLRAVNRPPLPIVAAIVDLMLPDGSGEIFIVEARHIGFRGRIVVHSGSSMGDGRRAGLLAIGADAVVAKPAGFAEIWAAVMPDKSI